MTLAGTKLSVYRTEGGAYIVHKGYITQWQGESGHSDTHICSSEHEVIAACESDGGRLPSYMIRLLDDVGIKSDEVID